MCMHTVPFFGVFTNFTTDTISTMAEDLCALDFLVSLSGESFERQLKEAVSILPLL